ncbi:DUF550 domain-containing protein [Salmonella enterica subsp. enterica]|nr:DUF550 domain-containing protein [Salmonella enterica subsp. enterica]EEA7993707.1 DUF550 domain-containing protein [Salmonella enterica subsp. enterica]
MTTITKERAQEIFLGNGPEPTASEERELARIALASLGAEKGASLQLRTLIRQRHAKWSDKTFGNVGPVGPLKHLSKEALEAAADPSDPLEWADMQFLLWDAQRRAGISDDEITAAMEEKLKVNMARQWPEPKDGEPRLHTKDTDNSPVIPDDWIAEAERLAELHGVSFVIFRQGEIPVCADPTKFWFGYDPAAPRPEVKKRTNAEEAAMGSRLTNHRFKI